MKCYKMETPQAGHHQSEEAVLHQQNIFTEEIRPAGRAGFSDIHASTLGHTSRRCSKDRDCNEKKVSPKQLFPCISCIAHDSIILCFVLSVWDTIVGPQTVYVWKKRKQHSSTSATSISYDQTPSLSIPVRKDPRDIEVPLPGIGKEESDGQSASLPNSVKKSTFDRTTCSSIPVEGKYRKDCSILVSEDKSAEQCPTETKDSHVSNSGSGLDSEKKNTSKKFIDTEGLQQYCEEDIIAKKCTSLSEETDNKMSCKPSGSGNQKLILSSVVTYVTEHAVGVGENRAPQSNKMTSLLLRSSSQNIIILSIKFSIYENEVSVPSCLSAVIPCECEPQLLPVLNLCMDSLLRVAAEIRLIVTKEGLESGNKVLCSLLELCDTLSSLREANLKQYFKMNLCCQPDDRRMAERMLTSHLQTMGNTLVIADSPSEANRVVMWLAQFNNDEQLHTSRISLSDCQWPYQPGITIQAVIRDSSGGVNLSSSKLLCSKCPLTLIDLTSSTVRQMAPIHVHLKNSAVAFRQHLLAMWHNLDNVPAPSKSLFDDADTVSPLVKRFLHEWDRLASCSFDIRRAFLKSFLRSLQYHALAIIMFTRNEWTAERRRREQKSLLQTVSSTFSLEDADLKVLLAQAEVLQPGFTAVVLE